MTMTELEHRVHDVLDGAAGSGTGPAPPPLDRIEAGARRRARQQRTRRSAAAVLAAAAVVVVGVLVVRPPSSEPAGEVAAGPPASGQPVPLGVTLAGAQVQWAADETQVAALRDAHPGQAVTVPWLGVTDDSTFAPVGQETSDAETRARVAAGGNDLVLMGPSAAGGGSGGVRYRQRSGDPTGKWFNVVTLSSTTGPGVASPWPTPASTVPVNDGVGWFSPGPVVDIHRFAWRTATGTDALLTGFGLTDDEIVEIARGAAVDGTGQLVPTRVPAGFQRSDQPPVPPATIVSKVQYSLPDDRFVEVDVVHGDARVLDSVVDGMLVLTNRVDIATVRGHRALITSSDRGTDFWVAWAEPETGVVVMVHAITRLELLSEVLGAVAPVDGATWRIMTEQHAPDAYLSATRAPLPSTSASVPPTGWSIGEPPASAPQLTEMPLPPSRR